MMSYKQYLLMAIKVTTSIAVPVAALLAILIALTDGLKAEGSLEIDATDGVLLLLLIPAITVFLCLLVSPVARPIYAFLDRRNRKSAASIQTDRKTED